jgi:oligopeptide/dipeptide ABC transporter ATP-binding protein
MAGDLLLQVNDLHTHFFTSRGVSKVLNGLDLRLYRGETLGLIGETGSGKSVAAQSIINAVNEPGRIVAGEVLYKGEDLLRKSDEELRKIRGREIALIVGDPRRHLNPLTTVGEQVANVLLAHQPLLGKREAFRRAVAMLRDAGFQDAEARAHSYPHQLSGGMAQRVLIAMALVGEPTIVLADDATSSLDVTIQRQVLDIMKALIRKQGSASIIITHDLGVVAHYCERVALMYAGRIVEEAPTRTFFFDPVHPYAISLLESVRARATSADEPSLAGLRTNPRDLPSGCPLHPRCPLAVASCATDDPAVIALTPDHLVRCPVAVGGRIRVGAA